MSSVRRAGAAARGGGPGGSRGGRSSAAALWGAAAAILAALASGCTTYAPHSASMGGWARVPAEPVGRVEGASKATYVVGLPLEGDDSLKAAVRDALSKKGGDTLVDATVDRVVFAFPAPFLPLYAKVETRVTGLAVSLKKTAADQDAPTAPAGGRKGKGRP